MEAPDPQDQPLPRSDPFTTELRMFLAPRLNPAEAPGPPGNPPVDRAAVARVARMLNQIVG